MIQKIIYTLIFKLSLMKKLLMIRSERRLILSASLGMITHTLGGYTLMTIKRKLFSYLN